MPPQGELWRSHSHSGRRARSIEGRIPRSGTDPKPCPARDGLHKEVKPRERGQTKPCRRSRHTPSREPDRKSVQSIENGDCREDGQQTRSYTPKKASRKKARSASVCQKSGGAGGTASCRGFRGRAPKPYAAAFFPRTSEALFAGAGGRSGVFRQSDARSALRVFLQGHSGSDRQSDTTSKFTPLTAVHS